MKQDKKVKPGNEVKVTPQTESFWKATHFISFMEPTKVTSSGFICAALNVKHPGGVSVSSARSALFPECNLFGEKMMPLTAIVCNSAIPLLRCVFLSRPLSCSASLIASPYLKSWSRRGFIVFILKRNTGRTPCSTSISPPGSFCHPQTICRRALPACVNRRWAKGEGWKVREGIWVGRERGEENEVRFPEPRSRIRIEERSNL